MKTYFLAGVFAVVVSAISALAGPREAQWDLVKDAVKHGLPKTAIEHLEPIIAGALADKAYAEAVHAIGHKVALQSTIQGNKSEEKIFLLEAELEKAPAATKSLMEALVAHAYWDYYQQNRWRFLQRTATLSASGRDLRTWDLARILAEIDRHFTAALADEARLKATPIREYDELFQPGMAEDAYRPTLYDFIAHDALSYYQAGEQGPVVPENEFEVDAATSPILADAVEFAHWQPASGDSSSAKLKALHLYQALLHFHQTDNDQSAYLDADLARLNCAVNLAVGEDKDERYKTALRRFIEAHPHHEIVARACATLAAKLDSEGKPAEAHQIAQEGRNAFPESVGAAQCSNLIEQIEWKSARIDTEAVWNAPWPTIDVTYRNVTQVYFRAVPVKFEEELANNYGGYGSGTRDRKMSLLNAKPALEWSAALPPTKNYEERTERLPAPTGLKPGYYLVFASHDPGFGNVENLVSVTHVWVSQLALVLQIRDGQDRNSGFVLDANTGAPVNDAVIRVWIQNGGGWPSLDQTTRSDEKGRFEFSTRDGSATLVAEHDGQMISTGTSIYSSHHESSVPGSQTMLFTDRSIYRPGQTINYKGISIHFDQSARKYACLANREVTVVFTDRNSQEIARATHRTNDYGSFSGVFTAPHDRLMGSMTLNVDGEAEGDAEIQVEEYKRPKFQVELPALTETAKLDQPITVEGKATAYTGAAIDGAMVAWRVERLVQLPSWCWWWRRPAASHALAHGSTVTDAEGSFNIQFRAQPDRSVPAEDEPVFTFKLHVDVTDSSGETRSEDRVVRAGYTALQAAVSADEWQTPQKPVSWTIAAESLDGDPQAVAGKLQIFALKQPERVERAPLEKERYSWKSRAKETAKDRSNPDSWELGDLVTEQAFKTDATGKTEIATSLPAGVYRATLETNDRFGKKVTARTTVQVIDPQQTHYGVKLPNHFTAQKWSVEPGETFTASWGTGYDSGRAFVELECDGKPLRSYWTPPDRTQTAIEFPITEQLRGGFTVRVTCVRENRAYINERIVQVPWSNQRLTLQWQRFRSKLTPGKQETWTAIVTGPTAKPATAEMVATLYDASLDQFSLHDWPQAFEVFREEGDRTETVFQNATQNFEQLLGGWRPQIQSAVWTYRTFTPHILNHSWGWQYTSVPEPPKTIMLDGDEVVLMSQFMITTDQSGAYLAASSISGTRRHTHLADAASSISVRTRETADGGATVDKSTPDLSQVTARRNLNETAFFFPRVLTDRKGVVKLEFTVPEALTEWKFLGFAHDRKLRAGYLSDKVVTAKELMVQPNPPRFLRERDIVEFSVKVSNQSDQPQSGTVRLTFADAASLKSVDDALGNRAPDQAFELPAKQSRSYAWRIAVPDGMGFLTYKAVAATARFSDGEEGFLPVLSNRILVTESLPLPIRGKSTKQFEFKKLLESGESDTLRHQSLTVQMTSRPAWYAVMALPYLMEFPYECSEQVFSRLYANALARHIATSDPKIRRVFDLWKNSPALDSPTEKNQDLKSIMLEETPWIRQAKAESESRKNLGLLFDQNRLEQETAQTLRKLSEQQLSDGLWPWFPGGRGSEYISLCIMTGFGRLQHLGVQIDSTPAIKVLGAIDAGMRERYDQIARQTNPEEYVPSSSEALYLYGRSFFLKDYPVTARDQSAVDFFLGQSRKFWLKMNSRQSQAHLALALHRFGDHETAQAIMRSIKERSVHDEELGMFWRETELSWWWYRAPIETQAVMIEAFSEVCDDPAAVDDCKVWLLKQKQTQDWKTTKATADAIYALLLRGGNVLTNDALVEVALAGKTIRPEKTEAGTGFYEQKFSSGQIKAEQGNITIKKTDTGVSWGSVHWQYLEDMAKITPHEGTPLTLKKTLYVKETTSQGPVLKALSGPLAVGDEVVVRIELRTDRDMEYVHLKDQRGSGTEPVNVLSGYRYRDGLAYYEMTRDTATHHFIDYLPKGVYVFEYSTRVQLKGRYQTGIAEAQCMYAPEFNSHSESVWLEVK